MIESTQKEQAAAFEWLRDMGIATNNRKAAILLQELANKILLTALLLLAGCTEPSEMMQHDQCLRREIFMQCLAAVPKGPNSTVRDSWADVVNECENAAAYQALRKAAHIKQECRI